MTKLKPLWGGGGGARGGGDYDELFGNFQLPSNFLVFISLERHLGSVACEVEPGRVR